jgi:fumarylacetoacetate (FAA) hydrolase family protein
VVIGVDTEVMEKASTNVSVGTGDDDEAIVGHSVSPDVGNGCGSEILSVNSCGVVWFG